MADQGLLHIALLARDLRKTEAFYRDVLGLRVAFRVPPNMLFLRSPGSHDLLNFVRQKNDLVLPKRCNHFGFKTTIAGLKRLEKRLKENHIEIEGRRGRNAFYFRDPNGYSIEYYCD
ncbi:MAG TPA: VOC family protein [Candidatus Udaeobacter sp.]|nr:VOC family protein [Candidatus Udaeobacter sp.]